MSGRRGGGGTGTPLSHPIDDVLAQPEERQLETALFYLRELVPMDVDTVGYYVRKFGLSPYPAIALQYLARSAPNPITYEQLEIALYGPNNVQDPARHFSRHVFEMRKALKKNTGLDVEVVTHNGIGWSISKEDAQKVLPTAEDFPEKIEGDRKFSRLWTATEDITILQNPDLRAIDLAAMLNRSQPSINARRHVLKRHMRNGSVPPRGKVCTVED